MRIAEDVPTLRIGHIVRNGFSGQLDAFLIIFLLLFDVQFLATWVLLEHSVDHRQIS